MTNDVAPTRSTDPRAVALLGGDANARQGFLVLAHLTARPRGIAALGRDLGITRQAIYRGLSAVRAAGFGPELDALPKVRTSSGAGRPARADGEAAARAACRCPKVEGQKTRHAPGCALRAYNARVAPARKTGGAS